LRRAENAAKLAGAVLKVGAKVGEGGSKIFGSVNNIQVAEAIKAALGIDVDRKKIAIKGDAKLEYPKVKIVMDIFQDQKINTFDLVTGLRGKNF